MASNYAEKAAARFAELHIKGAPLILYNAWDAGSASELREYAVPNARVAATQRASAGQYLSL
jgi:2-methylisocitrate lyase-like PEP mutase family enzyme